MSLSSNLIVEKLAGIVGSENVSTEPVDLMVYSQDASENIGKPDVIVWPATTEQVSQIMRLANEFKIPVVPRGAGTCRSGGPVASKGGILLVMTKVNKILEIDAPNFQVLVEPGAVLTKLNKDLKPYNLFLPPDPASDEACTVGGCVAECSGGLRAVKYGTFRDWVLGLEVVLPTGEIIQTGAKTRKSVSGYDLTRLFIGSEGTLGIITKVRLRVHPLPETRLVLTAYFDSLEKTGKAVSQIITAGLNPSAAELMDKLTVEAVSKYVKMKTPAETSLLLLEFDGNESDAKQRIDLAKKICSKNDAIKTEVAKTEKESEKLWSARKAASPALSSIKPSRVAEDITVPISKVPEMLVKIEEITKKYKLSIPTYGHAGDGNLHATIMYDERISDEAKRAKLAGADIFKVALEMGGTLSGEHGIGLSKAPYFSWEHKPVEIELMRKMKQVFDPNNILNPGKIFE